MLKKAMIACITAGCMLAVLAGCVSQAAPEEQEVSPSAVKTAPEVFVDDDGDLIQLAPFDDRTDAAWYQQAQFKQFNTNYLHADERGCKSCHADLARTVHESAYNHPAQDGLDVDWTILQCRGCHSTSGYQLDITDNNHFADIIHGAHMDVDTECWNCHATSSANLTTELEGAGKMLLWEDSRAEQLRGFTDIAADDLDEGTFSYNQDLIMALDEDDMPNIAVEYYENDYMRTENTNNDVPLDPQMLEDWTITVSGEVNEEKTFNLKELIDDPNVPKETKVMKWHCILNAFGGNVVGQAEMTGIPYSWLIEQCGGLTDNAAAIMNVGADGFSDGAGAALEKVFDGAAMVAYEMNGEPLSWKNGYPAVGIIGGVACGCYAKQLGDLVVTGKDDPIWHGAGREATSLEGETRLYNTPNIGIIGLKDGQVVKTGESIHLEGYADAFDKTIAAVELSFDRGATWKRFDIGATDVDKLTTWSYDVAFPEDGTYYIMARAEDSEGNVSMFTIDRMVTAVADPSALPTVSRTSDGEEK